ncbi:MAG: hypothetical protein GY928_05315, partial [Colwellia sp.]|nr:hypothetical protein [Colwellia sp.]
KETKKAEKSEFSLSPQWLANILMCFSYSVISILKYLPLLVSKSHRPNIERIISILPYVIGGICLLLTLIVLYGIQTNNAKNEFEYVECVYNAFDQSKLDPYNLSIPVKDRLLSTLISENNFNQKLKKDKSKLEIHFWTDLIDPHNLPDDIKAVLGKPLKFRPTNIDTDLFASDITEIGTRIIGKIKPFIDDHLLLISPFARVQFQRKWIQCKSIIFSELETHKNTTISNPKTNLANCTERELTQYYSIPNKYPNLLFMTPDKNRGTLVTDIQVWKDIQSDFLSKNGQNFISNIPMDKPTIIERGKRSIINILYEFADFFKDGTKCVQRIAYGYYDRIGRWNPFAKVHKKNSDGTQRRTLRPIVDLSRSIVEIAGKIAMELARKCNSKLIYFYPQQQIECDDVRDIVIKIDELNAQYHFDLEDVIYISDVNSMYDQIGHAQMHAAFDYCCDELLPVDSLSKSERNLYHKAQQHLYDYAYFDGDGLKIQKYVESQIQGSVPGSDNTSLFMRVIEIRKYPTILELFLWIIRYKDDLTLVPHIRLTIDTPQKCEENVKKIYDMFEFETEGPNNYGEIHTCDITLKINTESGNLEYGPTKESDKTRTFIFKNSNVKQSLQPLLSTLQERYIILSDSK